MVIYIIDFETTTCDKVTAFVHSIFDASQSSFYARIEFVRLKDNNLRVVLSIKKDGPSVGNIGKTGNFI